MNERCAWVSDSVLTSSPEPLMSGIDMPRSAKEPHAVRVSPVSMPAMFAMIAPVTLTPLLNLRFTPNDAVSLWRTAWSAKARFSDLSKLNPVDELSLPEKMFLNASSSRSIPSAARKSASLRALYSRLLKAAMRTASTSPISRALVPPFHTEIEGSSPPGSILSPTRQYRFVGMSRMPNDAGSFASRFWSIISRRRRVSAGVSVSIFSTRPTASCWYAER